MVGFILKTVIAVGGVHVVVADCKMAVLVDRRGIGNKIMVVENGMVIVSNLSLVTVGVDVVVVEQRRSVV